MRASGGAVASSAASELGLPDVEQWSRTGGFCAIVAGGFGAVVQVAIKGIPKLAALKLVDPVGP